jgi:carotenoid epsilon hydroxylase
MTSTWCDMPALQVQSVGRCRFIPFSGGPRKCVGDQFALMEAVVALAVMMKRFNITMVPDQDPGMTTGATIHTVNGLYVTVEERR